MFIFIVVIAGARDGGREVRGGRKEGMQWEGKQQQLYNNDEWDKRKQSK